MSAIIGACGQADGRESLIRVFNCSTRMAILRNARRMVSKVAVRQRDRFLAQAHRYREMLLTAQG